jgi:two-component system, OmpR family, phosphate regulon sensor histidine kinase PhoR
MNYSSPRQLSLLVAAVSAAFNVALLVTISLSFSAGAWYHLLILFPVFFVFGYFVFRYALEKFIYEKIRIIYKTIHSLKRPKDAEKFRLSIHEDSIERVNREVMEWGQDRTKEIEELKKLAVYRREFIGNVSHELKTPIFNIQGYVLTLLDGGLEDPAINREYLLRTEKSINRMIAIVEDLEAIAQLESGELKLNIRRFDLVSLAGEVIDFLEIKASKKNIHIFLNGNHEKPVWVMADKERIRQVLINLIDNSIKIRPQKRWQDKNQLF